MGTLTYSNMPGTRVIKRSCFVMPSLVTVFVYTGRQVEVKLSFCH